MPRKPEYIVVLGIVVFLGVTVLAMEVSNELGGLPNFFEQRVSLVEARYVCMVTDLASDREQIPFEIDGSKYYGCCDKCEQTLRENHAARVAADPVTGGTVDKAEAVIGALPSGQVYYFEDEDSLRRFRRDFL